MQLRGHKRDGGAIRPVCEPSVSAPRVASGVGGLTDARAGGYRRFAEEKWSLVWSGVCDALGQLHDLSDL